MCRVFLCIAKTATMVEQYIKNNLQREKRLCCTRTPDGTLATGENWSQNNLWCPNDPRGQGIDDDDDDGIVLVLELCLHNNTAIVS